MPRTEFRLAMTTTTDRAEAERLAQYLVEKRLAACVNIIPSVTSIYRWKGQVARDDEQLLVVKTRADLLEPLKHAIESFHSYECPELLVLDVVDGTAAYLAWLAQSLGEPAPGD